MQEVPDATAPPGRTHAIRGALICVKQTVLMREPELLYLVNLRPKDYQFPAHGVHMRTARRERGMPCL